MTEIVYELCLKCIGTVCFAQTTFITVIKTLFFKIARCFKNAFSAVCYNHMLFTCFSLKVFYCSSFPINIRFLTFFLWLTNDELRTKNQLKVSRSAWKNFNWNIQVSPRSLQRCHDVKNSDFWVAQEFQSGKRGCGRWPKESKANNKQNKWKCWVCKRKSTTDCHLTIRIIEDVLSINRERVYKIIMKYLHQDNTPAHNALGIQKFLAENNVAMLEQPS